MFSSILFTLYYSVVFKVITITAAEPYNLIDSHIHLYDSYHYDLIRSNTQNHLKDSDHSIFTYNSLAGNTLNKTQFTIEGAIYIEVDYDTNTENGFTGFQPAIEEYQFALHQALSSDKLLAIIPWAPLSLGKDAFSEYEEILMYNGETSLNSLVKGYRFLLQDKPDGTMLKEPFVEAINYLGESNLVFEVGIDFHLRGPKQLSEFSELVGKTDNVTYIFNHFAKPNLADTPYANYFNSWADSMDAILASVEKSTNSVYYKLSGLLEEFGTSVKSLSDEEIVDRVLPYFEYIISNVGHDFIIWGSNWPVVDESEGGVDGLDRWAKISDLAFDKLNVDSAIREQFYSSNALKAYNI